MGPAFLPDPQLHTLHIHNRIHSQSNSSKDINVEDLGTPLLQPALTSHQAPAPKSHWLQTTAALLTLQLGWGLWLLPADFSNLGWAPATGVHLPAAAAAAAAAQLCLLTLPLLCCCCCCCRLGALVLLCLLTSYSGVIFTRLYTLTPGAGEGCMHPRHPPSPLHTPHTLDHKHAPSTHTRCTQTTPTHTQGDVELNIYCIIIIIKRRSGINPIPPTVIDRD